LPLITTKHNLKQNQYVILLFSFCVTNISHQFQDSLWEPAKFLNKNTTLA
jgi:hypothetical protein